MTIRTYVIGRAALIGTYALILAGLTAAGCSRVPLLAPTSSTITVSAATRVLPTGGSIEVSAIVVEQGGTAVQNGTSVRFATSLGRVDPVEAQTRNGVAVTTFHAGDVAGLAEIRATSGGAGSSSGGGTGTGTTPTATNVVQIAVGAAAAETVTVRANPSTVSVNGGSVSIIATVVGANGRLLQGIPVVFSATRGTFTASSAVTDANGEAATQLTTNADTDVTATAGTKTSTAARVTAQPGPSVSLTCAVGASPNCSNVTQAQAVTFTAQRGATSSSIRSATLDFGDGTSAADLGALSAPVVVAHAFANQGTFTVRLTATDFAGESTTATQLVVVGAPATASVTATKAGLVVTATASVTGATVVLYEWTFEGTTPNATTTANVASFTYAAAGTKTISVRATLSDGRTVVASTSIVVP